MKDFKDLDLYEMTMNEDYYINYQQYTENVQEMLNYVMIDKNRRSIFKK
jgi:hypothetical protein